MSQAKAELGLFSELGLEEGRRLFWQSFESGKVLNGVSFFSQCPNPARTPQYALSLPQLPPAMQLKCQRGINQEVSSA